MVSCAAAALQDELPEELLGRILCLAGSTQEQCHLQTVSKDWNRAIRHHRRKASFDGLCQQYEDWLGWLARQYEASNTSLKVGHQDFNLRDLPSKRTRSLTEANDL